MTFTTPLAIFAGPYGKLIKWGVIGLIALACMAFGAVKMHQHDEKAYEALETQFTTFKESVRVAGEEAKRKADAQVAADKLRKEKADEENQRTNTALRADLERLRSARTGGSVVPAAAPTAKRPDLACFDRGQLERALSEFVESAAGLVGEGDAFRIDLNTAKAWAKP